MKKIKESSLLKRTLFVFLITVVLVGIATPFYINSHKKNDEAILDKLEGYETLIEIKLIGLLLDTKNSIDNNYLDELEQVAIKLDKNYRLISSFNKEEKDYYGYFSATVNGYIEKLRKFDETNNPSYLDEGEEMLDSFYDYKRTQIIGSKSLKNEDSLSNLIENGKIQIKESDESEVNKSDEK